MRRPRSGSHRVLRGNVWHYRRAIPPDVRTAFGGKWEFTRSLDTSNESEAIRQEKRLDVEFEEKLRGARDARDPDKVAFTVAKTTHLNILPAHASYRGPAHLSDAEVINVAHRMHQHLAPRVTLVA